MEILGYGEDALTFHALSTGFTELLRNLGDDTDPAAAVRFFRPSLGRRGAAPDGKPRSEFGEFDAIIGTARAVYLVEAKWSASSELKGTDLTLRPEQKRRRGGPSSRRPCDRICRPESCRRPTGQRSPRTSRSCSDGFRVAVTRSWTCCFLAHG